MSGSVTSLALFSLLIAIWLPILQLFFSLGRQNTPIISARALTRIVVMASSSTSYFFGSKLISVRSFLVSLAFSILYFLIFFFVAYYLAVPSLKEILDEAISDTIKIGFLYSLPVILCSFFVDFLSVVQTRYFLKFVDIGNSLKFTLAILTLDVLVSIFLFIVTFPLVMILAHYFAGIAVDGLSNVQDFKLILTEGDTGDVREVGIGIFSIYLNYAIEGVWAHPESRFDTYILLSPDLMMANGDTLGVSKFHYPFTTMLATNFITSIWIWVGCASIILVHLVNLDYKFSKIVGSVELPRRAVLYVGTIVSVFMLVVLN